MALGRLRQSVDRDLRRHGLSRERVVAAVLSVLELTYIRVGNEEYATSNQSYGLTTLRCRHIELNGNRLRMKFPGKGGKEFDVSCCDPRLARLVRRCQELPGQLLFKYEDGDGPAAVTSTDVNDYLREVTGLEATAKTFRTWGGTLMAAQELAVLERPDSDRAVASAVKAALEPVAARLGNTVAVCRNSYVHPKVITSFERGVLQSRWESGPNRDRGGISADERRLLHVLRS
jgi:DNA topoisomerase-1